MSCNIYQDSNTTRFFIVNENPWYNILIRRHLNQYIVRIAYAHYENDGTLIYSDTQADALVEIRKVPGVTDKEITLIIDAMAKYFN